MRIGLGLPAAAPRVDGSTIGEWAGAADDHGLVSVAIDGLTYDELDDDGDGCFDAVPAATTVEHLVRQIVRSADAAGDDLASLPCDAAPRRLESIAAAAGLASADTRRMPA